MSNREVRPPPQQLSPEEAREHRIRMAFLFGSVMLLMTLPLCCCLGSAFVNGTDDGHQTHSRRHTD